MKRIVLLLILALIPVAGTAEDFGCMDVITYLTRQAGDIPTQLSPYVQSTLMESEEGALRVHLTDALYIDGAVAAAWTIENIGNEPLYIVNASKVGNAQPLSIWYDGSGGILLPGETRNCGYAGYLSTWQIPEDVTDSLLLHLSITGLRILGEPVYWDDTIEPAMTDAERDVRNDLVDALFEEGKVVIDQYGVLQTGHLPKATYYDTYSDTPPQAQLFLQSGKVAEHSQITIETSISIDKAKRSALSDVSVVVDTSDGETTLKRTAISDARLIVEATFSFPDESSALGFYDASDYSAPFPIIVMESDGNREFYGMSSIAFASDEYSRMTEPEYQEDGTYAWHFVSTYWFIVPNDNGYRLVVE